MTTFFLIRHAQRDTADDLLPGRASGVRLTEKGRAQAERIAAILAERRIERIFSSPLERAMETAAPLARCTGLQVEVAPGLNEMDFGEWTGRTLQELAPDSVWRAFHRFRSGTRIPGGELATEVQQRFVDALLRWRDLFPEKRIACFSHADPIRLALIHFMGAPLDFFDRIEIDVGSISTLALAEWGPRIVRLNELP